MLRRSLEEAVRVAVTGLIYEVQTHVLKPKYGCCRDERLNAPTGLCCAGNQLTQVAVSCEPRQLWR